MAGVVTSSETLYCIDAYQLTTHLGFYLGSRKPPAFFSSCLYYLALISRMEL